MPTSPTPITSQHKFSTMMTRTTSCAWLVFLLANRCILVCSFSSNSNKVKTHDAKNTSPQRVTFSDSVQVFDNVFAKETCEELHYLAVDHAERCESSIFCWQDEESEDDDALLTPLEQALQSYLRQMHPTTLSQNEPVNVEYWCRDEYMNMDTHADIDEQELLNEGTLRCPNFGHVLYLDVDPNIRGPTCVFSKYGGWQQQEDERDFTVSLVTVPAVPGRVLCFPGQAMHAVPKPSTLWFLDKQGQQDALDQQDEFDVEEGERRSVILFNVWYKKGPAEVLQDIDKGVMPDGIEIDDECDSDDGSAADSYIDRQIEERKQRWEEAYGQNCCDLWSQPKEEWRKAPIVNDTNVACGERLLVRLMGNKARRLHSMKLVEMLAPSALPHYLQEEVEPCVFHLQTNEAK